MPTGISDAEWEVIKVIWDGSGSPMTAGQVVEALSGTKHWKPRTVKTLLGRLVKKRAVRCDLQDKRYVYTAVITRQDAVRREARWFLKRVFDGALVPAVVTFLRESDLSTEDLKKLRQILQNEAKR